MQADALREKFLDFFKSKKHKIIDSDSLVPKNDPTILFTPAGMNQFKKEFLGFDSGFICAATAQRCLRTDDLDKVGKTGGHHTFFEMLGNFSFGDYFKKEAISYAWEFLTEALKMTKDRLWISVYKEDAEAYSIWCDLIKVSKSKILKLGDKENFWPSEAKVKGPNGPCGPCSEIFFDQGNNIGCKRPDCNPACNCGRFAEVWNLVFTQFNRKDGAILEPLPKKNIDTGMGLERLAAVMQGVYTNFDTDLFKPLVKEIVEGLIPKGTVPKNELIYAVADHIRAITFAIFDGVLPSNETRGYVVRKLIRKSILHLRSLRVTDPFLYKLVPTVAQVMRKPYPELTERQENIAEVILAEEKSFISILNSSDILFKEKFQEFTKIAAPEKVGKIAFQLYDTYGIPLELTTEWLKIHSIRISKEAFEKELKEQKSRSKLLSVMKGEVFGEKIIDYGMRQTKFLGYKDYSTRTKIIKIIKDNNEIKKLSQDDTARIILEKTVFYPESGGQVGDTGELIRGKNIFEVLDTKKVGKVIVHIGKVKKGSFKKDNSVLAKINVERRLSIARNHSATHLLQAALRKVLGEHVKQQGSLVCEDRFRFDFTHFKDINKSQLDRIEEIVNDYVITNYRVTTKLLPVSLALKTGALAFFGEKYEGKVRLVSIGDFSKELCGGTHLNSTGQIGILKIVQEGSIASGIRRIEAVTGAFAYRAVKEKEQIIADLSSFLNVPFERIIQEIEKRNYRIKELERRLNQQNLNSLKASIDRLIQEAQVIRDIKVITKVIENLDMELLRNSVDLVKDKTNNAVVAIGSINQGKALLVMGITEDLCQRGLDASGLIRQVSKAIGGSGGGRKDFAQAGGTEPQNFEVAFQELKNIIKNLP